jgi:hypothetical protein
MSADIDTSHFDSASFDQLLRSFPTISHLRLASTHGAFDPPNDLLLALLSLPHTLCPALSDIAIFGASAVVSDAAALAFVKARMAMPTPLQQFRVGFGV